MSIWGREELPSRSNPRIVEAHAIGDVFKTKSKESDVIIPCCRAYDVGQNAMTMAVESQHTNETGRVALKTTNRTLSGALILFIIDPARTHLSSSADSLLNAGAMSSRV